ncbi:TetR/AcrR family transcriptional regulator [Streptomyces shenzhenensis]|uniref:TetR family transcriptional regulator n=1 Tax=Streptomyces shenzhenensis TaxID=943815 RepID=A0A3M0I084_9ACTN|nr:TetR/AcrR family transcriptional regulator [Streptomyces shenzhenensis]RMB79469.1 TetR family transcriptional regulator [Streptomyces shenzhenensis]
MVSRVESAAATRHALVDAAAELLDEGGPDAVTLRAVGARAGVSRGAPYGHFPDKEHLLSAVAAKSWAEVGGELDALITEEHLSPTDRLERALAGLMRVGRRRPHTYALMFGAPSGELSDAIAAVSRTHDQFLSIVTEAIGDPGRARPVGAMLLTSVHGIIGMENGGHLDIEKWHVTGDQLLEMIIKSAATHGVRCSHSSNRRKF